MDRSGECRRICPFQYRRTIHYPLSPTCNKTVLKDDLAEVKWKDSLNESRLTLSLHANFDNFNNLSFQLGAERNSGGEADLQDCLGTLHLVLYVEIKDISDVRTGCGVRASMWTCFHRAVVFDPCCVDMQSLLVGSTSDVAAEISGKCGMTKATEIIGLRSCGAVNPWGFRCYCAFMYLWTVADNEGCRHFRHKCSRCDYLRGQ